MSLRVNRRETHELAVFCNALREFLGLEPLYRTGDADERTERNRFCTGIYCENRSGMVDEVIR